MKGFAVQRNRLLPVALALFLLVSSLAARAQEERPGPPGGPGAGSGRLAPPHQRDQYLPTLTDRQKEQIRKLDRVLAEASLPIRSDLAEKEAHLRSLMAAREPDRGATEKVADEIGNLRKELFKARITHDLRLNGVLTEEQRAFREMHSGGPFLGTPPPGVMGPAIPPPGDMDPEFPPPDDMEVWDY
jgi:Spy/CpxP family protein refolding chaperone